MKPNHTFYADLKVARDARLMLWSDAMHSSCRFIAILLLSAVASIAFATPIPKEERERFVKDFMPTCLAKQHQDPKSKYFIESQMNEYCHCVANMTTDFITLEDLDLIYKTENVELMRPSVDAAGKYCAQEFIKKLGHSTDLPASPDDAAANVNAVGRGVTDCHETPLWSFVADADHDGLITIKDVQLWLVWLLCYPGEAIGYFILSPSVVSFLQLSCDSRGGYHALMNITSIIFWGWILFMLLPKRRA